LLEGLVEGAALAAIEGEHRGVGGDAGEGLGDDGLGDAFGGGLPRNVGDEGVEIATALGGAGRGGEEEERGQEEGEAEGEHGKVIPYEKHFILML
jgi:hypothetical protein